MQRFPLNDYINMLEAHGLMVKKDNFQEISDKVVEKVAYNSNEASASTLFVCKGAGFKEEYLDMAIARGALAYISEKDYAKNVPCILVKDIQKSLSLASILFYNNPGDDLTLIGITGTKGKSTTAYYVKYILDEYLQNYGRPEAGIISSIDTYDGKIKEESHLTTPESLEVQMHYRNAVDSQITHMVTEVSSQALKYGRLYGVNFSVGVFLNISEDHISPIEHPDLDDYFKSKLKLLNQCQAACVNLNSDNAAAVLEAARQADKLITFGTDPAAAIYGYDLRKDGFDTVFNVRADRFDREFRLTMPGLFNVENALAAIAVAYALDIPEEYIYWGLFKARSSGRMEIYTSKNHERIIIVDYAHNKLSFNKLYESTKNEYPNRKIYTVFGCPGGKAYVRRKDLGLLSGLYSDKVFLTSEDPGDESVKDICEDIARYVKVHNSNYEIIEDREEAIKKSIMMSDPDTVVLITGKGNETRQKIGKQYIECRSDVEAVLKYLNEYDDATGA
ncbi:MAG: UDP-N-acetylmuramoyl-L-alanyl-D-glutamate--2,6-diaminopimelate ligase [Syntrophomonadaceae bacterium]|nr:UDP-N-acetylmuramoyl-L-alanyl-D-glutamate--2,6-diaminopimelate ligase [Syntrophomonadaceae bacterium]